MFTELLAVTERPIPFSRMTVASLWTDPHVSEQMLRFHLDGSVDISSHRTEFIDAATAWMGGRFAGPGARVLDLGCGPGLYTTRHARARARVTGVDFSERSIAHARDRAAGDGLDIEYVREDYLEYATSGTFDLVTMIMRDYCAMSPAQRGALLSRICGWLAPEGAFVFDVDSLAALAARTESVEFESHPDGGFWSAGAHVAIRSSFVYPAETAALDKHTILERDRTRVIYNWVQFFSPELLAGELGSAGLRVDELLGDVTGTPYDPTSAEFAVVARPARS